MSAVAESLDIDTKVSNEGRVVIPRLCVLSWKWPRGDRVQFVVEDGEVTNVTAQSLLSAVWAKNHGGDAGDAVADVPAERRADSVRADAKWGRLAKLDATESRSEDEIEAGLLHQLGLAL